MGRAVDWKNRKLSAEDREYLLSRGERGPVESNDRMFGGPGDVNQQFTPHSAHELNPDGHIAPVEHVDGVAGGALTSEKVVGTTRKEEIRAKAQKLTVEKLREELDKRDVEYDNDDKKDALVDKLTASVVQEEQAQA